MLKTGHEPCLRLEPTDERRLIGSVAVHDLDRHPAVERALGGAVHRPCGPFADQFLEHVTPQRSRWPRQRLRIVVGDAAFECRQCRGRIQTRLLAEPPPKRQRRLHRLGGATVAVQGDHPQLHERLAERIQLDQQLGVGGCFIGPVERQQHRDPLAHRHETKLLQAPRCGLRPPLRRERTVRRAAPQAKRLVIDANRSDRIERPGASNEPFERRRVEHDAIR